MNNLSLHKARPISPLYVRSKVAAARLGVSHSWFWLAVKKGKLPPPQKIGKRMSLWHVADLDAAFSKLLAGRESTQTA
jgi:predicted DNA-binding transcriptional regulator AlpA